MAVFDPPRILYNFAQVQAKLMENRDISDLHFCGSAESIAVLVASGYGIFALPEALIPDNPRLVRFRFRESVRLLWVSTINPYRTTLL